MEIHKGDAIAALGTVIGADEDKVQIHIHGMEIRPSETGNILVVPQQILKLLERSSVQGDEVILKDGREGIFYSALNENVVIVLLHGHNEKDPDSYVNVDHNYIRCKNQDGAYKFVPAKREMPGSELVEDILKQFEQDKQALTDQASSEKASEADPESNSDESAEEGEPATAEIARITAHEGMTIPSDYIRSEAPIEDAITVEMPQESENFIIRSSTVTEQYSEDTGEDNKQISEPAEIKTEPESPDLQAEEDISSEENVSGPSQTEEASDSNLPAMEQETTPTEVANHQEEIIQSVEERVEQQPEDPERIAKLAAMKKGILEGIQEQIETEENPDSAESPLNEDEDILTSIQRLG